MVGALTFLLTSCLLQGFLCQDWKVNVPRTIEVIRGSCVTIPCSFHIDSEHDGNLDHTCGAIWKKKNNAVVFNSSEINQLKGELMGILKEKDCTTTLNMVSGGNGSYYFRLECNNDSKYNFLKDLVWISVKDDLPPPTLTPSTLKVKEGTVSLTCSAPAPCLPHPPTLTWTPKLGESQETLQENQDKTKVQSSVLTFTASHLHHGQKISCTAVYKKQDGSSAASVTSSLTADILFPPLILPSSDCTKTQSQVNCSCETVGNPSPSLHWNLNGLPVNQSSKFTVITKSLTSTSLRSIITVTQPEDLSTLLCLSFNSLGSASQQFCVNSVQIPAEGGDNIPLPVFVTTVIAILVLVCIPLFVISFQRNKYKSQLSGEVNTVAPGQRLREGNEVPNTSEDIYVNAKELRQADVGLPATISEFNSSSQKNCEPGNSEGASGSSGKTGVGNDVIYSTVNWKTKSKKKTMINDSSLCLEGEKSEAVACRKFVSDALEMESLYPEVKPRNMKRRVDSEYAQVHLEN